jgi:hypothetical protein
MVMNGDYREELHEKRNQDLVKWNQRISGLFNGNVPARCTWESNDEILRVLNFIGDKNSPASNHTFFPSGGGLDLSGAVSSNEEGKLELNMDGTAVVVNPDRLTFHSFQDGEEFNYFRLETTKLKHSGVYDDDEDSLPAGYQEEVLELEGGKYLDRGIWEQGFMYDDFGDEIPLPRSARTITRIVNGGAFVIFSKFSPYNRVSSTYDGSHNNYSNERFEEYIKEIVKRLKERQK